MKKIISFLSLAGMSAILSFCANPENSLLKRNVPYAQEDTQLLKGFNKLANRTTSQPCLKQIGRREDELVIPDTSDSFGQVVNYRITQIQTREDLEEHMDVSASASLNASVFGASGKMKFIQDNKIDRMAIYMLVSIEVLNPSRTARNIEYTDAAMRFLNANDFESFRKACGDEYIAGYSTGGSVYALVQLSTATREDREAVEASLAMNAGFFSASGDLKSRIKDIVGTRDVYAKILKTAGSGAPVKSDIGSVTTLVENFAKEVAVSPTIQKVVLRSYSTLPMNRIPNPTDRVTRWNSIEELSDLYKEQRKWLENIQYVLANPSYYVYTAAKEVELKGALEVVNRNINSITAAYEACNDVTRACLLPNIDFFYVELPPEQLQEKIPPIPDFAYYKEDAVCGAKASDFKEDSSCGTETYTEVCGSEPKWGVDGNICGWDKGQKELQPTWYCPGEQDAACRKLGAGWKLDAFYEETDAKQNRCRGKIAFYGSVACSKNQAKGCYNNQFGTTPVTCERTRTKSCQVITYNSCWFTKDQLGNAQRVLPAPPAPPVDARLSVEKDFDYQGGDYKRWAIQKTDDYKVCYKACAEDSACKAYAFVPAGYQEENPVCYLKNEVRPVHIWKGIVTGRRY